MDDPTCQRRLSYWRQVRLLATLDHKALDEKAIVSHLCVHRVQYEDELES